MFLFGKKRGEDPAVDVATENKRLEAQILQLNDQIEIISKVSNSILATLSLDEVLQYSIDAIVDKLNLLGAVLLLKEEQHLFAKTIAGGKRAELFVEAIGTPISSLKIQITAESKNLVVQSLLKKDLIYDTNLSSFTTEVLPDFIISQASKLIGIKMNVSIPIIYNDEVIGAVVFATADENFDSTISALQLLTKTIGISIINANLFNDNKTQIQQLGVQNRELNALSELNKSIISTLETDKILQQTVDLIPQDLGYIGVIVALLNKDKTELRVEAITNNRIVATVLPILGKDPREFIVYMDDPRFQNTSGVKSIKDDKIIVTDDFISSFSPPIPEIVVKRVRNILKPKAFVNVPLKSKGEILGVIGFIFQDKVASEINSEIQRFMQSYTHIVGIALDNSQSFAEKERLLGDLQQKIIELEEAYRTEKDMITILAHELRTPISTASNAFQVLSTAIQPIPEKMDEAKFNQYATIVSTQLKRLAEIVKTFMSGSETDNAKIQLNIEDVNLNETCETAHSNFATEAGKKGLTLNKETSPNTLAVKADKNRLLEIVDNLLSNAIKYTATGGQVTIKTIVGEDGFNGISVEDTGEGIPAEDIPNLGKKYYRVNQHIQDKEDTLQQFTRPGGTGLGLYVSFGLAKRMGGSIQVESEVGNGSKFTLWLPKK